VVIITPRFYDIFAGGILVGGVFFKLNGSRVDRVGLEGFGKWVGQCLVWVEGCGLRIRR